MRILYITARYPPHLGGTEIHTAEVALAMATRGHEVAVITTDRTDGLPIAESRRRLEVVRVKAYPAGRDYYFAPAIRRYLMHERPDLVHVQSYHTAVAPLALRWLSRLDVPYLLSFHSGGSSKAWRRYLRPVQHRILRHYSAKATALLAVSEFERELFLESLELDPRRIEVIRNGVSSAILEQQEMTERDPNLIISAGRLEHYKGHHRMIDAMPMVLRAIPTASLAVVGSGPFGPELEQMVKDLGVEDAVEFMSVSQFDRASMGRLLGRAAVSVHFSDYEAEGIGAIEARAMGCRVVVAANTALQELVDGGQVISVPDHPDRSAVATAVVDALKAGPSGVNHHVRTWEHVADDLEALYRRVLTG